MCGIAGKLNLAPQVPPSPAEMAQMLGTLQHRGPDEFGIYVDDHVGLANARLSIIDLESGQQPISNEDATIWTVFNGEIFNYVELRAELERKGHRFYTKTDTEVIVHLYEEQGPRFVSALNGQFAIALWDSRRRELLLARDRLGIRPLYYVTIGNRLLFASEVKALLTDAEMSPSIDPISLAQVFTFWTTLSPRSIFSDILALPPGHLLRVREDRLICEQYWALDSIAWESADLALEDAAEELRALLIDATRLRLRADVPVGAYLSGGLDSSTIVTLTKSYTKRSLRTFGIGFSNAAFDESSYQAEMVAFLGTEHSQIVCTSADILSVFPAVIWHTEMPLLRTSPAPMFLLSKLVHEHGIKVVLTGEGADEILAGYNLFKEAKIRRFWARQPRSTLRPRLLRRIYSYLPDLARQSEAYLKAFFSYELEEVDDPLYSHRLRWRNTRRCQRFLSPELQRAMESYDPLSDLLETLPSAFASWPPLAQAQYLESTIFMSEYLLSSQGDRMTMAHAVEGRYPFLDHRVVEFCARLPAHYKLRALEEKFLLKRAMADLLPAHVLQRPKTPYRAPISTCFAQELPEPILEALTPKAIRQAGYFEAESGERLLNKCRQGGLGETDAMALVGILSVQLLHQLFIEGHWSAPLRSLDPCHILDRRAAPAIPQKAEGVYSERF
ncbi:MAG: asparagine synthase (glutamine-hydrolyzing) [Chloroflexi bacterium]|nr:asparagine synthase (glutamine-hydrolyzing) [Chloroflexota bacterium]